VIKLFERVSDETLSEGHIKALCNKIYGYDEGKTTVSLPGSMSAKLYRGRLSFEKDSRQKAGSRESFEQELRMGFVFFEENPYALFVTQDEGENIPETVENKEIVYKKYITEHMYFDIIPDKLFVRNRRDGDKIKSGGMNKSVKRLLLSSDIPEEDRYLVPFISGGGRLLLVPGAAKDDNLKHGGKNCISVTLYRAVK
jgi:tRNA(Ile)-lysidine synthetase-like protein